MIFKNVQMENAYQNFLLMNKRNDAYSKGVCDFSSGKSNKFTPIRLNLPCTNDDYLNWREYSSEYELGYSEASNNEYYMMLREYSKAVIYMKLSPIISTSLFAGLTTVAAIKLFDLMNKHLNPHDFYFGLRSYVQGKDLNSFTPTRLNLPVTHDDWEKNLNAETEFKSGWELGSASFAFRFLRDISISLNLLEKG